MNELDAASPERLYRAAKRKLGDTSDAVWCDNDDDTIADSRLLARYYLRHSQSNQESRMSSYGIHNWKYTIRYVDGPHETQQDVWDAVCESVEKAYDALNLTGHLFVSVIGTEVMTSGPDPDDVCIAMYHEGIRHIAVAGGDGPEEYADDRSAWLDEIRISTVHEMVHCWQDLNGRLTGTKECEDEAEAKAKEILDLVI